MGGVGLYKPFLSKWTYSFWVIEVVEFGAIDGLKSPTASKFGACYRLFLRWSVFSTSYLSPTEFDFPRRKHASGYV